MSGMDFSPKSKLFAYIGFLTIASIMIIPAYADQTIQPVGNGNLEIGFSTNPTNPTPQSDTYFLVNFIDKSKQQPYPHIDYQIAVKEGNDQICGTGLQHTATGSITDFKCQLPDAAKYQVIVEVDGVTFQPITPVTATFTVDLSGGTPGSTTNSTQTAVIPSWVKTTAGWWSKGQVGDSDFIKGIQYMIQKGIIQIQQSGPSSANNSQSIPSWIKTTAGWWSTGQVGDQDFVKGIQWLISHGIIVV